MNRQFLSCAYDADNDGFWLSIGVPSRRVILVDRQGQMIKDGPTLPSLWSSINGLGSISAEDENPHLLLIHDNAVYDYNISNGSLNEHPIARMDIPGSERGSCIGKYDGKDALFVVSYHYNYPNNIYIFEINSHLAPIKHYRLYRTDSEGNNLMLADEVIESSYIDSTWNEAIAGNYRFGISEVYFNGVESEIIWTDTIVKTDFGMDENDNQESQEPSVQKVVEDGHIVIIKDGKRYSVSGQTLN